ncbi:MULTISPECIES: glycerol kinase GlpK [unclassified Pseudoalteromonas]|jgi:glycerol kinase|uniref:glycerol kinase GlpK n=1 Tax=unclassified Pseudoalteromonas TaxID=194690 RepID=UPI0002317DB3|nr:MULTISPECIES: glycerol kinase GlpK [unclassified Pseudoalteromonas]KGK01753.1 Glycerol kinase [Pseudoalteromonas sp. ND6B]MDN3491051.1 glycerol kinase GlpK [Pseudoalteromonas sp. APC 3694]GAA72226.1 glycerol kinase [Pseudoalteromonas sp. BSi20439]|tara:strand:+ start:5384 stop:6868 length:1485 start_codon:yes stop_codon:yes gene_type:complete
MNNYILSIDQGTTSSRSVLFDLNGKVAYIEQQEFEQHFPKDGYVEHKPEDIWESVLHTINAVMKNLDPEHDKVIAIGITNQRETTIVWDKVTGEPIYNAIVWQDRRTTELCDSLRLAGKEELIMQKTGLLIDPYFSATKINWILESCPGAREKAENGDLIFGTVDTYLLWKLTGEKEHRTDATNASRTMLFNIHTQEWDTELLELLDVPLNMLPEVMDSSDDFGMASEKYLGYEVPILGMAGDQQSALFGQTCFQAGMAKSTYGTGCFMMVNTGDQVLQSKNRLLSTVAYRLNGKPTYALEGSIFIAGAAIQWLRDGLQLIEKADETELLAINTSLDHGIYMVPAFTGLGAPYWDPNARGAIFGLTRDTGIKEIVTAGLQSVCFQTKDLQKAMESDGVRPQVLRVDGGMVINGWLMQFLSDVLGAEVDRSTISETTALGVAYLAGLRAGVFSSLESLATNWNCERRFEPGMTKTKRDELYDGWCKSVKKVQSEG